MRISFDLDDTLICYQPGVLQEPRLPWWWRGLGHEEPLRLGARQLLRDLQRSGHELWIYTTSYRDPWSVWWWLGGHGIWVRRVINQDIHDRTFRRDRDARPPSKNPRAFGIHLHIDDSIGVAEEGRQWGFRVLVLTPEDTDWTTRVRQAVR